MSSEKFVSGEGLSTSRKESLAQQMSCYYGVKLKVVTAVLEMNNWDVAKCVKVLPLLSNKADINPNAAPKKDVKVSNEKKDVKKKEAEKGDKQKQNVAGKMDKQKAEKAKTGKSNPVAVSKPGEGKKAKGKAENDWCVLELPKSIVKGPTGQDLPLNVSKSGVGRTGVFEPPFQPMSKAGMLGLGLPPPDTRVVSDLIADKKQRRKALKACYDIIRQKSDVMDRIHDYVKAKVRLLVLMRGCPGSGKSTCARELLSKSGIFNFNDHIFSTDNYFVQESGEYVYRVEELAAAHSWNQEMVQKVMKAGLSPVIVDNTHIKAWEMTFFAKCAVKFGYHVETMEARTPWFFNEKVLARKNTHGVPKQKIEQMLSNYEANISGDKLLAMNQLSYNVAQAPPQSVQYDKKTVKELVSKSVSNKSLLSNKPVANQIVPSQNVASQALIDFNLPEAPVKTVKDFNNMSVFDLLMNDECGLNDEPLIPVVHGQEFFSNSTFANQAVPVEEVNIINEVASGTTFAGASAPKEEQFDDKLNKLTELFPDVPTSRLTTALENASGNLLAAIGTLLEASSAVYETPAPPPPVVAEKTETYDLERLELLFPNIARSVIQSIYSTTEDFDKTVEVLHIVEGQSNVSESKEQNLTSNPFTSASENVAQELPEPALNDLASSDSDVEESASDSGENSTSNAGVSSVDHLDAECVQEIPAQPSLRDKISIETFREAMDNILVSLEKASVGNVALGEGAWEEAQDALASWQDREEKITTQSPKEQRDHKYDSATNTNYLDFDVLKRANQGNHTDSVVITGRPCFISGTGAERAPSSILTLDKSTTTVSADSPPRVDGIKVLKGMFPHQPEADLYELLKSCLGDVDWAVGLLLDSGLDVSTNFVPPEEASLPLEVSSEPPSEPAPITPVTPPSQPTPVAKKRKKTTVPVSELGLNFVMNEEFDSDHLRKIRNLRYGRSEPVEDPIDEEPQTSELVDETILNDEGDLALPLTSDFILNLQDFFGSFIPPLREDKIMVKVPVGLARQLHTYIMDSICQQYEEEERNVSTIIARDESLARQLQEEANGPEQPSLQEIMDKELALNLHRAFNKGDSGGETMAGQLSRQLLIEKFPKLDPVALRTLLEDTDHSLYQATQLLEAAGYTPTSQCKKVDDDDEETGMTRQEAVAQASAYRETAKCLMDLRADCLGKATEAFNQGNKSIASYYSEMARWHNERIEQANLLASTLLLEGGNSTATTLDLHFMRVREAVQVLDLFVDGHVSRLTETGCRRQDVYVITGRGAHSVNGRARLRPVVANRLKQRNIPFNLVNPGLFMVTLSQKITLTCHS